MAKRRPYFEKLLPCGGIDRDATPGGRAGGDAIGKAGAASATPRVIDQAGLDISTESGALVTVAALLSAQRTQPYNASQQRGSVTRERSPRCAAAAAGRGRSLAARTTASLSLRRRCLPRLVPRIYRDTFKSGQNNTFSSFCPSLRCCVGTPECLAARGRV